MIQKMEDCARVLTPKDIKSLEEEIGISFPKDYKTFLLRFNGGIPHPAAFPIKEMPNNPYGIIQEFFGLDCPIESSNLKWNQEVSIGRLPTNLFPFACTPSGDLICLSLFGEDTGAVVLWDFYNEHIPPTYKNIYHIANSFVEFIENIFANTQV